MPFLGSKYAKIAGFLRVSLQLHKWERTRRRRRADGGAEGTEGVGYVWGGVSPPQKK